MNLEEQKPQEGMYGSVPGKGLMGIGACGAGRLGKPTWGVLEAPTTEAPVQYPGVEGAVVRQGFQDTQRLREQSGWWARDEPYFMAKDGLHQPPLQINEASVTLPRRLV